MGPKLVNCCKLEQMGTKELGKMMRRLQTLEGGRVPDKEANNWRIEGEKKRIARKEYKTLNGAKRPVEFGKGENHERKRRIA